VNTNIVNHEDDVFFVRNTPGGFVQSQWPFQPIANAIYFGIPPIQAVDAPARISFPSATPPDVGRSFAGDLSQGTRDRVWPQRRSSEDGHESSGLRYAIGRIKGLSVLTLFFVKMLGKTMGGSC